VRTSPISIFEWGMAGSLIELLRLAVEPVGPDF